MVSMLCIYFWKLKKDKQIKPGNARGAV